MALDDNPQQPTYRVRKEPPRPPTSSLLGQSFGIGTYLGVRVSIHITFILYIAFELLGSNQDRAENAIFMGLLFLSVLLHEYGHALACKSVGGTATDILLWPLGGLAFCSPPNRPWPHFVTVICGPLVNVALCLGTYAALRLSLDPQQMTIHFRGIVPHFAEHRILWVNLATNLFEINFILGAFNALLIFYPFDGGRLVQIALWKILGFYRSMMVATVFGMIGAGAVIALGVWILYDSGGGSFMLPLIGFLGFSNCYRQFTQLRQARQAYGITSAREFDQRFEGR